jgi:hypothetical protein
MFQKFFSATKRASSVLFALFLVFSVSGCAQMIADSMYGDQYLKAITKSRQISAQSQKEAVNAAVSAAGKTEWTPKMISVETGYVLAEHVPNVKAMNAARNYAFRLEVRLPETGKGEATIVITPPSRNNIFGDDGRSCQQVP